MTINDKLNSIMGSKFCILQTGTYTNVNYSVIQVIEDDTLIGNYTFNDDTSANLETITLNSGDTLCSPCKSITILSGKVLAYLI